MNEGKFVREIGLQHLLLLTLCAQTTQFIICLDQIYAHNKLPCFDLQLTEINKSIDMWSYKTHTLKFLGNFLGGLNLSEGFK